MRTKNISSIDSSAEVVPVLSIPRSLNFHDLSDKAREHADIVQEHKDHEMLCGTLADFIRERYRENDEFMFCSLEIKE